MFLEAHFGEDEPHVLEATDKEQESDEPRQDASLIVQSMTQMHK
jgi:hypothetical protein